MAKRLRDVCTLPETESSPVRGGIFRPDGALMFSCGCSERCQPYGLEPAAQLVATDNTPATTALRRGRGCYRGTPAAPVRACPLHRYQTGADGA